MQRLLELPDETRLFMCHDYKAPGRDVCAWETTVAEQKKNVHLAGRSEAEFVAWREARDAKLDAPLLLLSSIQTNIRAGRFPEAESNGMHYLKPRAGRAKLMQGSANAPTTVPDRSAPRLMMRRPNTGRSSWGIETRPASLASPRSSPAGAFVRFQTELFDSRPVDFHIDRGIVSGKRKRHTLRSASEYRQHAADCRALAKGFDGERRQQTSEMAETWEELARQVDSAQNRHLAGMLKAIYNNVANEPVPEVFQRLLKQLETAEPRRR